MLQADRHSCKKIGTIITDLRIKDDKLQYWECLRFFPEPTNDVAFEARDMENDVDYDSLDTRLTKLEKVRRSLGPF